MERYGSVVSGCQAAKQPFVGSATACTELEGSRLAKAEVRVKMISFALCSGRVRPTARGSFDLPQ